MNSLSLFTVYKFYATNTLQLSSR